MSKIQSKDFQKGVLEFLPMRKVLQVITYSKRLHEAFHITKEELSLLKIIYDAPFAPLFEGSRFSKNSFYINGFLYNKLLDYKKFIKEQAGNINEQMFETIFLNYLNSLKGDFICMLDLTNNEGLDLARKLPNLKFGLLLDYSIYSPVPDLTNINLTYYSDNLEKLEEGNRNRMLDELAKCPNLEKMRITFPSNINREKMAALPKLRKLEIANNWRNGDELINALNSVAHMGDSIQSLTLYTIQKCVDENKIASLKEALSNFKQVKSLYLKHSVIEVIPYEKFVDIFVSFAPKLEKLKFDLDIFESKEPITFQEFKNLKKVIIKGTKQRQSPFSLSHIPHVDIKINQIPIHRGHLDALTEQTQGYHIVVDKEGYSAEEVKDIVNGINTKNNIKSISYRGIGAQNAQIVTEIASDYLEELQLMNIPGDWSLEEILRKNKALTSLTLKSLGNPSNNNIQATTISFPESSNNLKKLYIKKSHITNAQTLISFCKTLTSLRFDDLSLSYPDFEYFCENIDNLSSLEVLEYGGFNISYDSTNDMSISYNKFFEGISRIKTLKIIKFRPDLKFDINFLKIIFKNISYIKNLEILEISVLEPGDSFEARKILLQASEKLHKLKTLKLIMFDY